MKTTDSSLDATFDKCSSGDSCAVERSTQVYRLGLVDFSSGEVQCGLVLRRLSVYDDATYGAMLLNDLVDCRCFKCHWFENRRLCYVQDLRVLIDIEA